MKVIFDTNVIIDVVEKREPHFSDSYAAVQMATTGDIEGAVPASALTDIYYVIRRNTKSKAIARDAIMRITNLLNICDTRAADASDAIALPMEDYEDAVIAKIAQREKADYIVTRNAVDFKNSPIPAITPTDFINK